ncbi:hypothetical protein MASR1M31_21620 [Porphyromonadaceae bacterium]
MLVMLADKVILDQTTTTRENEEDPMLVTMAGNVILVNLLQPGKCRRPDASNIS